MMQNQFIRNKSVTVLIYITCNKCLQILQKKKKFLSNLGMYDKMSKKKAEWCLRFVTIIKQPRFHRQLTLATPFRVNSASICFSSCSGGSPRGRNKKIDTAFLRKNFFFSYGTYFF